MFDLTETRRICAAANVEITKKPCTCIFEEPHCVSYECTNCHDARIARRDREWARKRLEIHAHIALPDACNVIEALCDLLDQQYQAAFPTDTKTPNWITVALARKQAKALEEPR